MLAFETFIRKGIQSFKKSNFLVVLVNRFMNHTVRFDEDNTLFRAFSYPKDEIWIEAFVFIESDTSALGSGCVRGKPPFWTAVSHVARERNGACPLRNFSRCFPMQVVLCAMEYLLVRLQRAVDRDAFR